MCIQSMTSVDGGDVCSFIRMFIRCIMHEPETVMYIGHMDGEWGILIHIVKDKI